MNPHLGAQMLPYHIVFPTHAGADDATAFVASVLGASVASKDGNVVLRGGWFDLTQTAPFVFVQPAVTNAPPAIGVATPETLGDGPPSLDSWATPPPSLPLHGVDGMDAHRLGRRRSRGGDPLRRAVPRRLDRRRPRVDDRAVRR
jgi:hypothetical protein